MRYKNYVSKITKALTEYKNEIDLYEQQYVSELERMKKELKEMVGKYTPQYIEEFKKKQKPNYDYAKKIKELRESTGVIVKHSLACIEKQINDYINAPVKESFANKIMSISVTGLKLTDMEFKMLQDSATSYMEHRLLSHLASTRTKTVEKVRIIEDSNGKTERYTEEVPDAFPYMKMLDANDIVNCFNDYKRNANFLVERYAGKQALLCEFLCNGTEMRLAIVSDSYFRNNYEEKFLKKMEEVNSILPESKVKAKLTENDKKLIDALIDPRYPSLAESQVKGIAILDNDLRELFALDERYSKYIEALEKEEANALQ